MGSEARIRGYSPMKTRRLPRVSCDIVMFRHDVLRESAFSLKLAVSKADLFRVDGPH